MATQFEYKLLDVIEEVRSDFFTLNSLEIDRRLSEQVNVHPSDLRRNAG